MGCCPTFAWLKKILTLSYLIVFAFIVIGKMQPRLHKKCEVHWLNTVFDYWYWPISDFACIYNAQDILIHPEVISWHTRLQSDILDYIWNENICTHTLKPHAKGSLTSDVTADGYQSAQSAFQTVYVTCNLAVGTDIQSGFSPICWLRANYVTAASNTLAYIIKLWS